MDTAEAKRLLISVYNPEHLRTSAALVEVNAIAVVNGMAALFSAGSVAKATSPLLRLVNVRVTHLASHTR